MTASDRLRETLASVRAPLFAVIDGAQFDDLPAALFDRGLVHRPLYLDRAPGGRDRDRAAPQLVWLDRRRRETASGAAPEAGAADPAIVDLVLDLSGDRPAVVFWACPGGGEVLFRHLRGINMVSIPRGTDVDPEALQGGSDNDGDAAVSEGVASPDDGGAEAPDTHELVLFRHADANVMAQVLPSLGPAQSARLFGPASEIVFAPAAEWSLNGDVMTFAVPPETISRPGGPLRLDDAALERIGLARTDARDREYVAYIRDVAPEMSEGADDAEIASYVRRARSSAGALGIETDYGLGLWALMLFMTVGAAEHDPDIRRAFAESGLPADAVLQEMAEGVARSSDDDPMWKGA